MKLTYYTSNKNMQYNVYFAISHPQRIKYIASAHSDYLTIICQIMINKESLVSCRLLNTWLFRPFAKNITCNKSKIAYLGIQQPTPLLPSLLFLWLYFSLWFAFYTSRFPAHCSFFECWKKRLKYVNV